MRVVLGEDQYLLRKGLTHLLEDYGFELAAVVDNGPDLLSALLRHRPDVALVDVRLPPTFTDEGLQAALTARRAVPGLPVLVLSQHVEQLYARELLADGRGGIGYLLKDRVFDDDTFIDSVRRVASGGTAMDPEVISQLFQSMGPSQAQPLAALTVRERGAGAHGGGQVERGDRGADVAQRQRREQARGQHLRQAGPGAVHQ